MLNKLQMFALENACYVLGAGAFSVFIRWLQIAAGTTEEGLFNDTVWCYLVPITMAAGLVVVWYLCRKIKKARLYMDDDVTVSLRNDGKLYKVLRIVIGAAMAAGGALLILGCETEKTATLLRVEGGFGILTGAAFPFLMASYNREELHKDRRCLMAVLPLLLFASWLIATYKANDINSVVWAYGIEIICICFTLFAFFRAAGFAFGTADPNKFFKATMTGAFMLIVALADERLLGQQVMLVSAIAMLEYYDWVATSNLLQRAAPMSYQPTDGFERL